MLARWDNDPIEPVVLQLATGQWVRLVDRRARDGDMVSLALDITEQMRIWAAIEAIPDGRGVHMIDGKMQDDATWKQCKVMVDLAEMLAEKDPELKEAYGF